MAGRLQKDPEIDDIKKQINRFRAGKAIFTIQDFYAYFAKLLGIKPESVDLSLFIIPFLQIMDMVSRALSKDGMDNNEIIAQMNRYPLFVEFVNKKYYQYKQTGKYHGTEA